MSLCIFISPWSFKSLLAHHDWIRERNYIYNNIVEEETYIAIPSILIHLTRYSSYLITTYIPFPHYPHIFYLIP